MFINNIGQLFYGIIYYIVSNTIVMNIFFITRRILERYKITNFVFDIVITIKYFHNVGNNGSKNIDLTDNNLSKNETRNFLIFTNTIRYYSQYIDKYL